MLGAVIPDFGNAIGWLAGNKYLRPLFTLHHGIHDILANKITTYDFPNKWLALFLVQLPIYFLGLAIFLMI
jgi:hypothetical protein